MHRGTKVFLPRVSACGLHPVTLVVRLGCNARLRKVDHVLIDGHGMRLTSAHAAEAKRLALWCQMMYTYSRAMDHAAGLRERGQ